MDKRRSGTTPKRGVDGGQAAALIGLGGLIYRVLPE